VSEPPDDERALWQGLAQICVGLTHLQRGNLVGAGRLLRRGAGRLAAIRSAYGVDVPRVRTDAMRLADQVDRGAESGSLQL